MGHGRKAESEVRIGMGRGGIAGLGSELGWELVETLNLG